MDLIVEYSRALDARDKARRAVSRFIVAAIEVGIIPTKTPLSDFGVLDALALAPVSWTRRRAALRAYRAAEGAAP